MAQLRRLGGDPVKRSAWSIGAMRPCLTTVIYVCIYVCARAFSRKFSPVESCCISVTYRGVEPTTNTNPVGDARFSTILTMPRDKILAILRNSRQELRREFGVESIALFGSVARGEAGPGSDIDILVDVPGPISLFQLVALRLRLQELLNAPNVDVVLRDSILPPLRETILAEALRVA